MAITQLWHRGRCDADDAQYIGIINGIVRPGKERKGCNKVYRRLFTFICEWVVSVLQIVSFFCVPQNLSGLNKQKMMRTTESKGFPWDGLVCFDISFFCFLFSKTNIDIHI